MLARSPSMANRTSRWTALRLLLVVSAVAGCFVLQQTALFALGSLICAGFALRELGCRYWSLSTFQGALCLSLLFLPAFLKPENALAAISYALSTIAVLLAAWALAQYPPVTLSRVFRWLYVICAIGIALGLVKYAGEPEPLGALLPNTSTNGIPSYMLVLQVAVSLSFFAHRGRLPMLSPWITAWIAFEGIGRASLIVAGLIIGVTLVFNLSALGTRWGALLLRTLLLLSMLVLLAVAGPEAYDWVSSHTKLSVGLIDVHRASMLADYWAKIDATSLFIGMDFSGTIIEELYNGNPHIAFLRTHSFFGLPLTLLALLSPLVVCWAPLTRAQKRVYMTFCALLLLRAMTEPILFPTLLDLVYFTVLFLPFRLHPSPFPCANSATIRVTIPGQPTP